MDKEELDKKVIRKTVIKIIWERDKMKRDRNKIIMKKTKNKRDKRELNFVQKYKHVFNEWWDSILETNPTYIVAITRKGPRMLEIFNKYGKDSLIKNIYEMENIISEKAIPFMSDNEIRDSTFTVIDDILIYGSTLKTALKNIEDRKPKSIRWATFTYDFEENKIPELDKYHGESKLPKTKEGNAVFCDELVSSFRFLIKPYDVDHPIIYLKAKNYYRSEKRLEKTLRNISNYIFNATSPRQRAEGICRFSCLFSDTEFLRYLFDNLREIDVEVSKMRLYVDLNTGDMALAPIYLFSASVDTLKQMTFNDNLSFLNDILREANKRLYDNGYKDNEIAIGMIRLHTFLIEYLYGRYFILKSKKLFDDPALFEPTHFINDFDIRILFGKSLAGKILGILSSKKEEIDAYIYEIIRKKEVSNKSQEYTKQTNDKLRNRVLYEKLFQASEYQSIRNILFENKENDDLVYNLWRIFRLMHQKDKKERERKLDIPRRTLNIGFSFSDINEILSRELNYQTDKYFVSAALDYLIDQGAVVPVFAVYNGWVGRVFRFGENINIYGLAMIFHGTLESFVSGFPERYITKFYFEKLLTFVGGIIKKRYALKDFDLEPFFDKEGARLKVIEREKYESPYFLDQFCKNHNIIDKQKWSKEETRIYLNENFYDQYPRGTHNIPPEDLIVFSNIGGLMWDICFNSEIHEKFTPKQIFLAFTTCNNKENFLNAIKKDVEILFDYLKDAVNNLEWVLSESQKAKPTSLKIEDFVGGPSVEGQSHKKEKIGKYIEEVSKVCGIIEEKWEVYAALKEIKERLDKLYSVRNSSIVGSMAALKTTLKNTWIYCRKEIIPFNVDEKHKWLKKLKDIGEQYNHIIEAVYKNITESKDRNAILQAIDNYRSLVRDRYCSNGFSYLAFSDSDINIIRDTKKEKEIIEIIKKKFRLLQGEFESTLASEYAPKPKKSFREYMEHDRRGKKYSIDEIPGKLDKGIFIGGDFNEKVAIETLKDICDIIWSLDFQPICALYFEIPPDKTNEYCSTLLAHCSGIILELSWVSGGPIIEYVKSREMEKPILIVHKKNTQISSMIKTARYSDQEIRSYETKKGLFKIIEGWLERNITQKEVVSPAEKII